MENLVYDEFYILSFSLGSIPKMKWKVFKFKKTQKTKKIESLCERGRYIKNRERKKKSKNREKGLLQLAKIVCSYHW